MKAKNYRRVSLILVETALSIAAFCGAFICFDGFPAAASPEAKKEFPNLKGAEAIEHLKKQGVYSSLQKAVKAARQEESDLADPQIKLTAGDGTVNDGFGHDVAISGNTAVFAAAFDDAGSGAVYVFVKNAGGWTQQQKLTANDGQTSINFGWSAAIEDNTIVVGAPGAIAVTNPNGTLGAAYVFTRSGTFWTQQQRLTAGDGERGDEFGFEVAISGGTVVVGTRRDSFNIPGKAYVFVQNGSSWQPQQTLTASDGAANNFFGSDVEISGDTIVVGAFGAAIGGNQIQGAAYIFAKTGTTWIEQQKLFSQTGAPLYQFGIDVAVSGDTIAVGEIPQPQTNREGAVYVYVKNASGWTLQQKLTSPDVMTANGFGSVSLDGDNLYVGDRRLNVGSNQEQGAVYQFTRSNGVWNQQRKLVAADGNAGDHFGGQHAVSGNIFVVGVWEADVGANVDQGAGYIFECGRSEQQPLTANDGAAFDQFGSAIAVSGETVVVGAALEEDANGSTQGAAYVFVRGGGGWVQQQKLTPNPRLNNAEFGHSVDISGETIVVGAWRETTAVADTQGAAYVFVRSGASWTQQARLQAGDATFNDQFGNSVAIDGETIVVGAAFDDVGASLNQGSAYVFVRGGAVWTQQARISSADGAANDNFGHAVDISGGTIVAGAYRKNSFQGAAYVFTRSGAAWSQQQKLTASDGAAGDEFGSSVTISGDTTAIGAYKDDFDQIQDKGSVYVFTRSGSLWTEQTKIFIESLNVFALFGSALSLDGENLVVGQNGGLNTVWVFVRDGATWTSEEELGGTAFSNFGEAVGVSGETVVVGALAKTVGSNSQQGEARVYYGNCSTAPLGVASAATSRRRCKAPAPAILGTVSDGQEPAGSLAVTAQTVPAGITLTNLTNTNGTVTADVGAECGAVYGANSVTLRVSDAAAGVSTFNATINVIDKQNTADFDGDRKTDISIFRPSNGQWWYQKSSDNAVNAFTFGAANDKITPADFDGDGKTDAAFWRPASGEWFVLRSSNATFFSLPFGLPSDKPQRGDFDGDGRADLVVYRPSNGVWYILRSTDNGVTFQQFGVSEDTPVAADYDDDGRDDIAVFRPSTGTWWINRSTAGLLVANFGVGSDKPVPGDYTGDGKTDMAVWRASTGEWFILRSEDFSYFSVPFGASGDIPAPGDFDGDGKFDFAVFRPSDTNWYVMKSTGGFVIQQFGASGDVPAPAGYIP